MSGVLDLELTRPLPDVPGELACTANGKVRCLVRARHEPVAIVDIEVPRHGLTAAALGAALWRRCGADVRARFGLALDGLDGFPTGGLDLPAPATPLDPLPAAAVVVATRDRADALARCLDSLLVSTHRPARIVVVDNAPSDDATERMIAERYAANATIHYVREPEAGLARAHNAALPHITESIVAFTDDDVLVDTEWLERMVRGFGVTDDVACVTGLIFPAELTSREQWWVELYSGFSKGLERRIFDTGRHRSDDALFPFTAGTLGSGANMAFTTAHLAEVGGFDPLLGAGTRALGGDDLAAFYRVVTSGHRLVYEPAAVVFHHHRRDFPALRRQVYGYGAGLTAYLTGVVVARPGAALSMARRMSGGIRRVVGSQSPLAARRPADYPRELVRRERIGMLTGPGRYLRSRWEHRHDPVVRPSAVLAPRPPSPPPARTVAGSMR
ncbi:MAG: pgaC 1 [Acidimicrobiales bacterium]|nr:pgaC 1 [Acidimicrobiales bacterium]